MRHLEGSTRTFNVTKALIKAVPWALARGRCWLRPRLHASHGGRGTRDAARAAAADRGARRLALGPQAL